MWSLQLMTIVQGDPWFYFTETYGLAAFIPGYIIAVLSESTYL